MAKNEIETQRKVIFDKVKELEQFNSKINQPPPQNELAKTPDGKALSLPISFIEMKLDEIYLGQWGIQNFTTKVIANEVVGECELWVIHPVTELKIVRTGAAAIQIMVDKVPDGLQGKERNEWALNLSNKKASALDLGYPKLKAETLKNAAQSLGKLFGRDINRKLFDEYTPEYMPQIEAAEALLPIVERMKSCKTIAELLPIWDEFPDLQNNKFFKKVFTAQRTQIQQSKQLVEQNRLLALIDEANSFNELMQLQIHITPDVKKQFELKLAQYKTP